MIKTSVIDQVWTFRDESFNQQVVISQGEQVTAPIGVSQVQLLNHTNEIQRIIVTLVLRLDRVQFDASKFEIDGLAISGKSIRAISRRSWDCWGWDVEIELIPKERIFNPISNIQRLSIPVYPMALAHNRSIASLRYVDVSYVSNPPARVSRLGWQSSEGVWRQQFELFDEERAVLSKKHIHEIECPSGDTISFEFDSSEECDVFREKLNRLLKMHRENILQELRGRLDEIETVEIHL